ncbi:MAG TPA: VWA domain-containing protein [Thermoanaerobaculia bacterium]|nr:VWA domain-containing protein [Thermoanaerobaculia bacterium]
MRVLLLGAFGLLGAGALRAGAAGAALLADQPPPAGAAAAAGSGAGSAAGAVSSAGSAGATPAAAAPPAPAAAPGSPAKKLTRKEQKEAIAKLPKQYQDWLDAVELIITADEKAAFLALDKDYQRDAFIARFWEVRDRGRAGSYRQEWEARIDEARNEFHHLNDERARIFLLNGTPAARIVSRCTQLIWPLEAWYYHGSDRLGEDFIVIFYQHWGAGPFRIWDPMSGIQELFVDTNGGRQHDLGEVASSCPNGDQLASAINWVASQRMGYAMIQAKFDYSKPKGPGGEWVTSFHSYSTDIPSTAQLLPAKLEVSFPGRHGSRTLVQGLVTVPVAAAKVLQLGEHRSYDLLLTGEVLAGGKLFENFRYKFDFPGSEPPDATLPLVFQRPLRPGDYTVIVKIEDLNAPKVARLERAVSVPVADQEAPPPPPTDPESARLLREANAALGTGETALKIIAPRGELQTGMLRFDTLATGRGIDKVTFALDGKAVLTKLKPPFSVELDLGRLPRPRNLTATAYDSAGNQVASDQITINAVAHRFKVRLAEPQRGKKYESSLLARAETDVPEGEMIDHVELYLNETLVATLFQPPYTQPIVLPKDQPIAYVRAVAYTPDGNSTEDLVFVNSPDNNIENLNVQFVELYTSVLDRRGRPVAGLAQKDFTVFEDGVKQSVARFERVTDLPIHAAVVLDTSASMEKSLETSRDAALRFLQEAIKPKDRAAIITFNDHPNIGVKFSNDPTELAGGLAGLKAERGTALYDTIIFSLFYFNGIKGQRALLLLTDGRDENSRFGYEDTVEYARRAGVTIFTIGLGEDIEKKKLTKISEETGGRAFFIKSAAELTSIYTTIQEELRSQYLIAYQSTNTSTDANFRSVDLKLSQSGLEAKTLRGYYP